MGKFVQTFGFVLVAAGLLVQAGCQEAVQNPENDELKELPEWEDSRPQSEQKLEPQPLNDEVFVDAERVAELANRDDQPATVIDARSLEKYKAGHYPGAVHSGNTSDYKPFKDPEYNDVVPRDVAQLQQEARKMGVFNDRPLVVYAGPGSKRAGRLHWALEFLGHGNAYIYSPGYEKLIEKTDASPSTETADLEGDFVVRRRPEVYATTQEVKEIAEGKRDGILVDTRRKSEFTGEEKRAPRHGYIPEAQYYYWKDAYNDDGELRPKSKLQQELRGQVMPEDGEPMLVPYCQTGTRSGYFYSVLRWLGAEKVANYDGSWTRWARRTDTDVAKDGDQRLDSSN